MAHERSQTQSNNTHRLRVDDFVVTTIQDAYLEGSLGLISNVDKDSVEALHASSRRPTPPPITLNVFLVDTGERRVLIDTGLGALAGDEGARLFDGLADIGLTPADIDMIALTHAHPDHLGGLITRDDEPAFPEADVVVPPGELDFWRADVPADAGEALQRQFAGAHRVFAACDAQIRALAGEEVVPGITRVPLPGHTPDHSGYRIESNGERLLIAGDIVHLPQIQFPRPDAGVAFDIAPDRFRRTREALFAALAESGEMVAGHHFDFPGVGYVATDGDGYRFLPHVWSPIV